MDPSERNPQLMQLDYQSTRRVPQMMRDQFRILMKGELARNLNEFCERLGLVRRGRLSDDWDQEFGRLELRSREQGWVNLWSIYGCGVTTTKTRTLSLRTRRTRCPASRRSGYVTKFSTLLQLLV